MGTSYFSEDYGKYSPGYSKSVCVYLDDILVSGKSEAKHLNNLEQVLSRLQGVGAHLKKQKCDFMRPSVEHLARTWYFGVGDSANQQESSSHTLSMSSIQSITIEIIS